MNPISAFVASVFRDACTASREERQERGGGGLGIGGGEDWKEKPRIGN